MELCFGPEILFWDYPRRARRKNWLMLEALFLRFRRVQHIFRMFSKTRMRQAIGQLVWRPKYTQFINQWKHQFGLSWQRYLPEY